MKIIKASQRFYHENSWLKGYFLFNFDNYYDKNNSSFNSLLVFNDDYVAPKSGFPFHAHENMEIVTIVLSGAVSHKDNTGGDAKINALEVQRMSAGTGIVHSEMNNEDEELNLYQLWLIPRKLVKPGYEQKKFSEELQVVASGQRKGGLYIESEATIYRGKLDGEINIDKPFFLYVTTGTVIINDEELSSGDQVRSEEGAIIKGKAEIVIVSF